MWDIYVAVAKQYANNLREEVKKGVMEKLDKDGILARVTSRISATVAIMATRWLGQVVDATTALVKLAFELYDTGNYSIKRLCEELKTKASRTAWENRYLKATHYMLRDKFYIGIMTWLGKRISWQLSNLSLMRTLRERAIEIESGTTPRVEKRENLTLLKGKVHCAKCGGVISCMAQKGHWYGECKSNKPKCTWMRPARSSRRRTRLVL